MASPGKQLERIGRPGAVREAQFAYLRSETTIGRHGRRKLPFLCQAPEGKEAGDAKKERGGF